MGASRWLFLTGVLYVVLAIVANDFVAGAEDAPPHDASDEALAEYYSPAVADQLWWGLYLEVVALLALLAFALLLSNKIRSDSHPVWGATVLVGGVLVVGLELASFASQMELIEAVRRGTDTNTVRTLVGINEAFFALSWVGHAVFWTGIAGASLGRGPFPPAFGYVAVLLALALLASLAAWRSSFGVFAAFASFLALAALSVWAALRPSAKGSDSPADANP